MSDGKPVWFTKGELVHIENLFNFAGKPEWYDEHRTIVEKVQDALR